MFFLGQIAELSRRLPMLLEEAEGRGSLLRATFLRIGFFSHVAWLALDDPERARAELATGMAGWQRQTFDYMGLWVRGARADISLYCGEPPVLADRVDAPWRAFARALDRFVQLGFMLGLDNRARRRVAAAARTGMAGPRAALLRGVEVHARALLRQRTRWGNPVAWLLHAGAASVRGERERAVGWLDMAEQGFVGADMALHAAVARRRRGELLGGDAGRRLVEEADAWMSGEKIQRPERMSDMLAPGRWA
jgi:hypothetical protein